MLEVNFEAVKARKISTGEEIPIPAIKGEGSSVDSQWELIADITLEEDTKLSITTDMDGNPLMLEGLQMFITFNPVVDSYLSNYYVDAEKTSSQGIGPQINFGYYNVSPFSTGVRYGFLSIYDEHGYYVRRWHNSLQSNHNGIQIYDDGYSYTRKVSELGKIWRFRTQNALPAGTNIKLYGIK